MTRLLALIPLTAVLMLAACDDQNAEQAEAPELNEYDSPEPAAPVEEPVAEEPVADAPPTDLTPAEEAVDIVQDAAGALTNLAAEQLNELADGQPLDEAASDLASDVVTSLSDQLGAASEGLSQVASDLAGTASETADAVQEQTGAVADDPGASLEAAEGAVQDLAAAAIEALTPEVDWQSTFSPDVPFYNLSEEPVTAFTAANGTEIAGTVAPGDGGFIETCNATLDWCLIPFGGEGDSGWVDMSAFGGVAN